MGTPGCCSCWAPVAHILWWSILLERNSSESCNQDFHFKVEQGAQYKEVCINECSYFWQIEGNFVCKQTKWEMTLWNYTSDSYLNPFVLSGTVLAKESSSQSSWFLVWLLCLSSNLVWEASWGEYSILAMAMFAVLEGQSHLKKNKCGYELCASNTGKGTPFKFKKPGLTRLNGLLLPITLTEETCQRESLIDGKSEVSCLSMSGTTCLDASPFIAYILLIYI